MNKNCRNCLQREKKKKRKQSIEPLNISLRSHPSQEFNSVKGGKKRRGTSIVSKCPLALSGTVRFIHVEKRRALFGLATRTGDEKPRGGIVCIAATFLLARLTLSPPLPPLFPSSFSSRDLVLARDSYRRFCRSSFQELLCCLDVITGYLSFALRSRKRRNGAGLLLAFPRMESFPSDL